MVEVPTVSLDSLNLARVDLIKIDVEGMEMDALDGAAQCIGKLHPILLIETIKSDKSAIAAWLDNLGYTVLDVGINFFAIHADDKCLPPHQDGEPCRRRNFQPPPLPTPPRMPIADRNSCRVSA